MEKAAKEQAATAEKAAREKAAADRAKQKAAAEEAASLKKAAKEQAATAEEAAREKAAAAEKEATLNNLKAPVEESTRTKEKASKNKGRAGRAVGANNKRQKIIQGANEEQIKRKQPGRPVGTEHCWSCGDDVPQAQYSHEKQCCSDEIDCKRRKDDKGPQVRARKRSTRYAE